MKYFWNRLFARCFDYGLFYLLAIFTSLVSPIEFELASQLLFALLVPLFWAPIEALLIRFWGTTPGKWLFGIAISQLSMKNSFRRAFFFRSRPGTLRGSEIARWRYMLTIWLAISCGSMLFFGQKISDAAVRYEQQMVSGSWVEYTSEEGQFTVQFPKKPKVETTELPIPNSEQSLELSEYKAESEALYSVSHLDLPRKWTIFSAGIILRGAMNAVVEHMSDVKMTASERTTHKGHQALKFTLKQGDKEVEGRLILVGKTLYRLTVTYPPGADREQQTAFFDSFELKSS